MTLFQSRQLEPTINVGINETHMLKTNTNTTRLECTTRRHDFTRLREGKNKEASNKVNFMPQHRHFPSTSRFQRASRFASENTYPRNSHWTPTAFQHGHHRNRRLNFTTLESVTRERKLKWYQSMLARPSHHTVYLATLFGSFEKKTSQILS